MRNVVLAGGSGTRLWPLSRRLMPKQFLQLFDGKSLYQMTLQRNRDLCDDLLVITNDEHYFLALDQMHEIGVEGKFILEEVGRNTAAAIAFAAFDSDTEEILFITPSDHLIKEQNYKETMQQAIELAKDGYLVTFGIRPDSAHTGYGYIEAHGYDVKRFYEKPSLEEAKRFLENGFYWNSGMFMFKAGSYLEELQKFKPKLYEKAKEIYNKRQKLSETHARLKDMEEIEDISIDYAVMEKSSKIKMVPAAFSWSDMGSFDALIQEIPSAQAIEIDSSGNFYHTQKAVAAIGLKDFIVIDTNDALLIVKKGKSQKVKEVVKRLEGSKLLQTHSIVHRPWGTYEVLIDERGYKIKRIVVKPGKRLSLQKHFHRNEHWIVLSGTATVTVGDKTYYVRPNESTYIKMGEVHRLANDGKIPVVLIEAQVGEYTGEDDIVRIDDDFKREIK